MYVAASASFEAVYESSQDGLVGTLEVSIIDNIGNVVFGPTTAGISEQTIDGSSSGVYTALLTAPADFGQYTIVWSFDGTYDPYTVTVESLTVTSVGAILPPIGDEGEDPIYGPCSAWTTIDEIAACCTVEETSGDSELIAVLTNAATAASQILYDLSGRQFTGSCQRTVRPCATSCMCGVQVLSRGHLVGWSGDCWSGTPCGCQPLSEVKLAGYPVRSITEVKIDGVALDPSEYRLDGYRHLVRLGGAKWPACQSLDLADTEEGTWSVTYVHGQIPPQMAQLAAQQLACEVYKSCQGLECALPMGATRITRQGITIERTFFALDSATGVWRTGMPFVDGFLNAVNPSGLRRRPTFWGAGRKYPRRVGA